MILSFIFAHLNAIALGIWTLFFVVVFIRYVRPHWVRSISYVWLALGAVALHLFYGIFVTWGQYHLWSISSDFTRTLLAAPLPLEAPLPWVLEYARSSFEGPLGYFTYYAFGHFFMSILMLFLVTGFFYAIFKLSFGRLASKTEELELLCVLMLISGWPGVVVLIPLGFVLTIIYSASSLIFIKKEQTSLLPAFFLATLIALVGGETILNILSLYPLLKL